MAAPIHKLINEAELFSELAGGSERAFESIYRHYIKRLSPFVDKMVRSPELAEEIVLEKALNKFPIKELADADQKGQLLASLKKGNMQQVTIQVEGKDTKMFIEANPRFRTLNIRDELGNTVKRERVEKKDLSKTEKLDEAPGQGQVPEAGQKQRPERLSINSYF